MDTNVITPSVVNAKSKLGDFGLGKYSPLMGECFRDLKRCFKLSDQVADAVARRIGSDFGAIAGTGAVGLNRVKVGKFNSDDKCTVKEAANAVKNVSGTNGLRALRALAYLNEAGKHEIDSIENAKPSEVLAEWFKGLAD